MAGAFQPNRRRSQPPKNSPPSTAKPVPAVPRSAPLRPILRSFPNPLPQTNPRLPPPQPPPSASNPPNGASSPPSTELTTEPRHVHRIPGLYKFDKLLNFLLKHRPHHVPSLINECWSVYNSKYKKSKTTPSKSTPPRHQSTSSQLSQPPIESFDLDQPPPLPEPQSQPEPEPAPVESLEPPFRPTHPPPPSQIPLFDRQARLEHLVYQRWNTFHTHHQHTPNQLHSPTHDPQQERQSNQDILVWQSPDPPHSSVFLDTANWCLTLRDADSDLSPIHLKALTFLWHNLIENPCSGAIFNHGIGYPRTHVIFLFAHLVLNSPKRQNYKILVVCSPAARAEWDMAGEYFIEKVTVNMLTMSQWQENINQWRRRGGVLVADHDTYANILRSDSCPEKFSALSALCCPGPDICILDEAANTNIIPANPQCRRFLNRTRTKARLALTSLSLAGFITRAWSIADWACPRLFGTNIEYYSNSVHPIARGHECNSTAEQALEAFRKACLLFNKMSMVTFNIDSSTRRESLSAKGLSIRESVVWVNISREEFAIYTEVERLLSNAVKQKGLSPFLAVDLLICAATSVHALRRTAKTWASAGPRSVQVIGEQAHELFLELAHMMDSRLNEDLTCTKLQLTLYLGRQCLETKERLVIFTSSQDLLEEVHIFLTTRAVPQLDKTKVYTYDAPQHTSSQKNLPLEKFNTASDGAILIAPYGPIIHCMEESGWGFINATRVLFIDSSWHSGVSVQAVNRVHHFAQLSNVIHVHHFLARDTVEDELSSQLERRYKRMLSYDNLSETAISSVDERGFLTAPEVSSELIRDNPPQQISRSAKPSVKKLDTDEQDSSAIVAEQDEMVSRLKETWDPTNHEYYVHEIILCSNRYRMMSENLDLLMQSEWSKTPSFFTEVVDGAKFNNLIKLHRESLHTFGSYAIDAMGEGLGGEWLAQDCTYMEQDLRISYLLTSWEPYRRLFESTEVSDLPQLPQNRKEKRHRPYDEPGRHPKIFRHEEVL